jgi:predicted ATP-dependent endonuclease of OLD family
VGGLEMVREKKTPNKSENLVIERDKPNQEDIINLKLKKLKIKYFRHMQDIDIDFGDYITVISGLNGTGKSSVLGLAGHIFSFRKKPKSNSLKTISENLFETEFSEIFKFCPKHDIGKKYNYNALVQYGKDEITKNAKSRFSELENRFRIDVGKRKGGEGKVHHPVIFLGLKRLFPIAQEKEKDIHKKETNVTEKERNFYKTESDKVFVSLREDIIPQHINTRNKDFLCINTPSFGFIGNSAGQDNLGQILTAILSFKRLDSVRGILLIDELDTTFFPGSQINLVKRLYDYARKFNLQIIFTTHSLEIIKLLSNVDWEGIKINFLELRDGLVVNNKNPPFNYIKNRIMIEANKEEDIEKINLLCEDKISELWCKNLVMSTDFKKIVEICGAEIPNTSLASLASKNLPCFKNFLFILDGESRNNKKIPKNKNILFLPGNRPPETIFYKFLKSLKENDSFWGSKNYFYKDTCFNGYVNEGTLQKHKKWFKKKSKYFGKGNCKLFNRWKKESKLDVEEFLGVLKKKLIETKKYSTKKEKKKDE